MAKSPKKSAAAFFDIDNTLVRGSTSFLFGKAAYKRKFFPRKDFLAFAWHQIRFIARGETEHMLSAIKDRALELVKGRSYEQMEALIATVYDEEIKTKVWPETAKLAQQHIEAGREVWLITAAPQEMGAEIAKRLGLAVARQVPHLVAGRRLHLKLGHHEGQPSATPVLEG